MFKCKFWCFLGGTKSEQYNSLPTPIQSRSGFQGCISGLETNGDLIDPIRHALVPSRLVEEGCEGNVSHFSLKLVVTMALY